MARQVLMSSYEEIKGEIQVNSHFALNDETWMSRNREIHIIIKDLPYCANTGIAQRRQFSRELLN